MNKTQLGFGIDDEIVKQSLWSKCQAYHLLLTLVLNQKVPHDFRRIFRIQALDSRENDLGSLV